MIRSALEGQMYVALTTYSHSSEHPMWRVHVALSERVTDRGHYAAIVDVIHARFGAAHPMDPRSRLPEQFDFDHQHRRLRREYADVFASSDAASHIDLVDGLLRATRAELRACARRIGQASRG